MLEKEGKPVMNQEQYGYGMEDSMGSVDDDGDFVSMAFLHMYIVLHG